MPQGLDWARPATAACGPLADLWKLVKASPGGAHEVARRVDLPVYSVAQILLGREALPADLCRRVTDSLVEGRSAREASLAEVRWQNLVRLLRKAFKEWPPRMAAALGMEDDFIRQLLVGNRRMSEEMARSIEDKMGLPERWMDQTEAGDHLTGDELLATRAANLLSYLVVIGARPEEVEARLPASADSFVGPLTNQLAKHYAEIGGKGTAEVIDLCGIAALRRIGHRFHHDDARLAERQLELPEGWLDQQRPAEAGTHPPPG